MLHKPSAAIVAIGAAALGATWALTLSAAQVVPVIVTVNPAVRQQTMRGWGGTLSFTHDLNYVSQETLDQIIDEAVNNLGLTVLRIRDGALSEPFNDNTDPNSIDWSRFHDGASIDREVARGLGRFVAAVRANGEQPTILLDLDRQALAARSWMTDAEIAEHQMATILYYKNNHGIDVTLPPNDEPAPGPGSTIQDLMNDLTIGGVSSWTKNLVADSPPNASGSGNTYFTANFDGTSFHRSQESFQFRQFMQYVRPGAVRIGATPASSSLRAMAFEQPGGYVAVVANTSASDITVRIQGLPPASYTSTYTLPSGAPLPRGEGYSTDLGLFGGSGFLGQVLRPGAVATIFVKPANAVTPLVWRATPSFLTLPEATVTLSANGIDLLRMNDGGSQALLTYVWSNVSAPAGAAVLIDPRGSSAIATGLSVPGTYVFRVDMRSCCFHGAPGATRDVTLRVYAANQPPIIAEGHRFFKQGVVIAPVSSQTFGSDFIRAFDLEGDPLTTSFSVVSQPSGANVRFSGTTATGMNRVGAYAFRFTASDPTHTVTRDFVRQVVPATGNRGRRRLPSVQPVGRAVPRGASQTASQSQSTTLAAAAPVALTDVVMTADRERGHARLTQADRLRRRLDDWLQAWDGPNDAGATARGRGWRRIEMFDTDDDGVLDLVQVEFFNGEVWAIAFTQLDYPIQGTGQMD